MFGVLNFLSSGGPFDRHHIVTMDVKNAAYLQRIRFAATSPFRDQIGDY